MHRGPFAPVDAAGMIAFRILLGVVLAAGVVRFWARGWIEALYLEPGFHFHYFGLSAIEVLPPTAMYAVFAVMFAAAVLIAAGIAYRLAVLSFFVTFTYVELLDVTYYLNHYYFVSIVAALMLLMPLGGWPRTVPAWAPWVLRLQLGLVYGFAGLAKLSHDWLVHAEPLRTWLETKRELALVGPLLAADWFAHVMSIAGAAFDLTIFAWLSWSRTRVLAYAAVVGFHVVTGLLFNIGMFPWIMIAATTVFFEPDWPRRLGLVRTPAEPPSARASPQDASWLVIVLTVHFALQLVLPLRHLAYPGDVRWHEQGFRFAWRVMLIEKTGMVEFRVHAPDGRRWTVAPRDPDNPLRLTPLQYKMMSTQPDLILQYGHAIADMFARRGISGVRVHADAWASLNGRPSQRLVDPHVDLAAERDGFAPKAWIPLEASSWHP